MLVQLLSCAIIGYILVAKAISSVGKNMKGPCHDYFIELHWVAMSQDVIPANLVRHKLHIYPLYSHYRCPPYVFSNKTAMRSHLQIIHWLHGQLLHISQQHILITNFKCLLTSPIRPKLSKSHFFLVHQLVQFQYLLTPKFSQMFLMTNKGSLSLHKLIVGLSVSHLQDDDK